MTSNPGFKVMVFFEGDRMVHFRDNVIVGR